MVVHGFDFRDFLGALSLATCLFACLKTFGWNTALANSSVVISRADFFFAMMVIL
jgi:hypothetical protein